MATKIVLPWNWTDEQMADYVAKYFAPNGPPPGTLIERAPAPTTLPPIIEDDFI